MLLLVLLRGTDTVLFKVEFVTSINEETVTVPVMLAFVTISVIASVVMFSPLTIVALTRSVPLFKIVFVTFSIALNVALMKAVVESMTAPVVFVISNIVSVTLVGIVVSSIAPAAPLVPGCCVASSNCLICSSHIVGKVDARYIRKHGHHLKNIRVTNDGYKRVITIP